MYTGNRRIPCFCRYCCEEPGRNRCTGYSAYRTHDPFTESTQNYNQQIENSGGAVSDAEKELLPRLKDSNETEVIIVTLAETTPFYEAKRLLDDLKRAGLAVRWWVINASYSMADTKVIFEGKSNC